MRIYQGKPACGCAMSLYSVESESYRFMIKRHLQEIDKLTKAYKTTVAQLAFSALLNVALFMAWFWEVIQ
jgi:hypothetical protein